MRMGISFVHQKEPCWITDRLLLNCVTLRDLSIGSFGLAERRASASGTKEERHFDITYTLGPDKPAVDKALQQIQSVLSKCVTPPWSTYRKIKPVSEFAFRSPPL